MAEQPRKPKIRRRRIIERPRLIRALDRSHARVRMLVAGSGYGKTILAEQWAARDSVTVGWFRARHSAADVAVVARALVTAAEAVIPGAGRRLLERLSVTQDPERESSVLAEMLAEDLTEWPDHGWIVIDDYQHLAVSVASETFVKTLVDRSPVGLVVAARDRPSWVRPRSILAGEVLVVPQAALAMSTEEVETLLSGTQTDLSAGLVALAGGWPAVVGLAAMAADTPVTDADLPETLSEYFADELWGALDPTIRAGLATLAAMPLIDRELAVALLGAEQAARVCDEALALGILDERDARLELHPLVERFLERRGGKASERGQRRAAADALRLYRARRDWDPAFDLVRRYELESELVDLMLEAIEETVHGGRLVTLREWIEYAKSKHLTHPVVVLGETELHLRTGRHTTALTLARAAIEDARGSDDVKYRLTAAAARAAHVGSREEEALELYQSAVGLARTRDQEREARWGELACSAVLERPQTHALLADLERSVLSSDLRGQVRLADRRLAVGFRFGVVSHLAESRTASELVGLVDDPFVRCSFRSVHGWALALGAFYDEALTTARTLIADATESRVEPALPWGFATEAVALAGLRRMRDALERVEVARLEAHRVHDANGLQNAYAIRIRLLLQIGDRAEACATEPPIMHDPIASMRGEVLGSRALALATIGRVEEASLLAEDAVRCTRGIEADALYHAVRAVCALKSRSSDVVERCQQLMERVLETGAADIAVTAYRANPELLATFVSVGEIRDQTLFLVRRARDEDLLASLGLSAAALVDPLAALTPREREVYELMCAGLTNPEIARRLYIAPSTVKVHVHHVFDKVGIRSRTALALNAVRDRYAAPAEAATPGSAGSG